MAQPWLAGTARPYGQPLEEEYTQLLTDLGKQDEGQNTTLGLIFHRARNRLQNPANLRRLIVDLIDKEEWHSSSKDIKGDAYEALIARSAEDTKAGAGQYFTPRVLIESIVRCMRPTPDDTITDPACGTGGFLLAAHGYIVQEYGNEMSTEESARFDEGAIWGYRTCPGDRSPRGDESTPPQDRQARGRATHPCEGCPRQASHSRRAGLDGPRQPALRQEVLNRDHQRRWLGQPRGHVLPPQGLLGDHHQ